MLYIGTSGFRFADWKGAFYPEGLRAADWLDYYAKKFNCLEVNASYYGLLKPSVYGQMAEKTPTDFLFAVKTYKTLTHQIGESTEHDLQTFLESLQPLIEADKFGCVLAQFPPSFRNETKNRGYLAKLQDKLGALPLVAEFRGRDWLEEAVFLWLRERGIGFCAVDEPQLSNLMPPVAKATSQIGYVRFHGRNAQGWYGSGKDNRYDYLYSEEELQEWVPKIKLIDAETQKTFIFMNNCHHGKAAINAQQLQALLEQA